MVNLLNGASIIEKWNRQPYCINISVPALSIIFIKLNVDNEVELLKASK
ncbi:hypothetical protein LGK95_05415 [Clostridium algoriphilum]|nr:hypothetical protein [Clostridium algoriphilum]MCB2292960.1 hypothetical protein [Clostridium algoriphilum]